jgi:hypothetical protein
MAKTELVVTVRLDASQAVAQLRGLADALAAAFPPQQRDDDDYGAEDDL